MSGSIIPESLRALVFKRDAGRCTYCHALQVGPSAIFHVDHIHPRSKGGPTTPDNLALQCPHCSLHKSDKTHGPDPTSQTEVRLFHPLTDRWDEHFSITPDGTITGKSDIGRATIDALSMNNFWPRSARALQIAAGWLTLRA